jgi:hypothetical protein
MERMRPGTVEPIAPLVEEPSFMSIDPKRRRLLIIVLVVLAAAAVGALVNQTASRSLDTRASGLRQRLERAYGGSSYADVAELEQRARFGPDRDRRRLTEFLQKPGTGAYFFAGERDGYRARYRVETWGRSAVYEVTWTTQGTTVDRIR